MPFCIIFAGISPKGWFSVLHVVFDMSNCGFNSSINLLNEAFDALCNRRSPFEFGIAGSQTDELIIVAIIISKMVANYVMM